ncbi:MAG: NADH-quinone oxidoreductase subunit NuoN [Alphaproteobacteria bacterium]|nr:NADH-quinone oxidoreductase subunit NuoN [Alphaproteobacteria bacterium]
MLHFYIPDLKLILPEIIITVTALLILMVGSFKKNTYPSFLRRLSHYAIIGFILALGVLVFQHHPGEKWVTFEGQIIQDDYIYFAKILVLSASAGVLAISVPSMLKDQILSFEYPALILLATVGMLLMIGANDFLSLFVGLEMQSLSLYILAALNRDQVASSEAALKYFILGALATTFYLYGVSLGYGFSGTTSFESLVALIRVESVEVLPISLFIALVFIVASFSFKVSAVPFHMWTPDVYQGCPLAITAYIAAAPKVAAMIIFLRLMVIPFMLLYGEWQSIIVFVSLASMILGAFAALRQTDLKRLLAYSTIGQMGYVLMGVAAGNDEGVQSVFVYLTIYLVMIIGTFGCLLCLRGKAFSGVQKIEDLSGISILHPKIAFILAIFMFSLAGIPPLAGFFAKFYVFKAAISAGLFSLAIVGVLTSVVATYYYIKIVKVMYFDDIPMTPSISYGEAIILSPEKIVILNLCAIFILFFFAFPNPVLELAQQAALALPN